MTATQLYIEVSDPDLAETLRSFLEHTIYTPAAPQERIVSVTAPEGFSFEIARAELDLYLETWRRLHPEASVNVID